MVCRQNKWNSNVVKRIVHVYENAITFHEYGKRKSNSVHYTNSIELVSSISLLLEREVDFSSDVHIPHKNTSLIKNKKKK